MGSITDSAAFSVGCRKAISKWPENAQQNVYRFPTSILRIFRFAHSAGPLHFQPTFKPLSPCLSCGAGGGWAGSLYAGDQHFHSSGPQGTRIVSGTLGVRNQRVPTGVRKTISIRITYFPAFVQLFLSCKLPAQVVILNAKEHEAPRTGRFGSIAFIFLYHNRAGKSSGRAKR